MPASPTQPPAARRSSAVHSGVERSAALDVLRALAVLLVMFRHSAEPPSAYPEWLRDILGTLLKSGWIGVDLFFVLSGFLISGLLFSEFKKRGGINVGRFLIRRGFKIYPPFYFFLIVSVLVQYFWLGRAIYFFRDAPERIRPLWPELVFMQSYFWGYWNHTWSLAVEEHFYLALPLVLAGLLWISRRAASDERPGLSSQRRDGPLKPLILIALTVIGAAFVWRTQSTIDYPLAGTTNAAGQRVGGFHLILHFTRSHMRVDSLLVGVMLGYFYHFHRRATLWLGRALAIVIVPACAVGIASLLDRPLSDPYLLRAGFLVLSSSFAGLLWVILSFTQWEPVRRVLSAPAARPLRWLWAVPAYVGMYSYSIYLWHMPMADWGHRLISDLLGLEPYTVASYHARILSVTVLSVIVGIIAAKVVEFPALRLRDRLFPSLSGAVLGGEGPATDLPIPHGTHTHQDLRG